MTLGNSVFEITTHRHPMEIFGVLFEAFVCSLVGHVFIGDSNDFSPDVGSFIACFIGNI